MANNQILLAKIAKLKSSGYKVVTKDHIFDRSKYKYGRASFDLYYKEK